MSKFVLFQKFRDAYVRENLRFGQATFNAVYDVDPKVANKLRGTEKDCFYDDKKVNEFMCEVLQSWEIKNEHTR